MCMRYRYQSVNIIYQIAKFPMSKFLTLDTKHQTPNTKLYTPNTKHQTPNTKLETLFYRFHLVSCSS